jgi:hypothetical protein
MSCAFPSLNVGDSESTQPNPPLTISQDDQTYVLHTNTSVRQSAEEVHATTTTSLASSTATAIIENVLDLETDNNSVTCQVKEFALTDFCFFDCGH